MSSDPYRKIIELQSAIKILENENANLTELSEDTSLLSLAADAVNAADDFETLIETVLEQIAILKNIPFCGFGQYSEKGFNIEYSYSILSNANLKGLCLKTEETPELPFPKSNHFLLSDNDLQKLNKSLAITLPDLKATSAVIFTFSAKQKPTGFFIFIDDSSDDNLLGNNIHLLRHVIRMTIDKAEKIILFDELKQLNNKLDRMVQDRTQSLKNANIIMENEIKERRIAQRKIKKSEEFLSAIFSSINDGVCVLDKNLNIILINPVMEKMFADKLPLLGKKSLFFNTDPTVPDSLCPALRSLKTGRTEFDIIPGPDNSLFDWLEVYCHPIKDPDSQKTIGVAEFIRDISDKVNADKEVQYLRNYLSDIIDSMPSVIIGITPDARITQWNKQASEFTGLQKKGALDQNLFDIIQWLNSKKHLIEKSIHTNSVQIEQKFELDIDDDLRFIDIVVYPLHQLDSKGVVIRLDDVTEATRIEELLIQNEKMLSVGNLAAGLAHEINNPLSGILQNAKVISNRLGLGKKLEANLNEAESIGAELDIIRQYIENREIPSMIESMINAGHRIAELVEDMLSFSRKENSHQSRIAVCDLFDKTLRLAATDFNMKQIEIIKKYQNNIPLINGEPGKLQQVFLNILNNGVQAMIEASTPSPCFTAQISYLNTEKQIQIKISDNGPGMKPSIQKRIFEPFFTTKLPGKGTGLGLSLSYFIITETYRGELAVNSTLDKGTCFTIRIPVPTAYDSSLNH